MDLCGRVVAGKSWMPACAGMTVLEGMAVLVGFDLCGRVVAGKSWMPACAGMTVLVGA
jgi:hypothetical protein